MKNKKQRTQSSIWGSLNLRLIIIFLLMALLVGVVGIVAIINLENVEEVRQYHSLMSIPALNYLDIISINFGLMHGEVIMADSNVTEHKGEYSKTRTTILSYIAEYEALSLEKSASGDYIARKEMRAMMSDFSSQLHKSAERYDLIAQEIFTFLQHDEQGTNTVDKDISDKLQDLNDEKETFIKILENTRQMELAGVKRENSKVDGVMARAKTNLLALSFIAVLFSITLGILVSYKITKPLEKLSQAVDEVSKGNFNVELEKTSSINDINNLTDSLSRIMSSMKLAALKEGILKKKEVKK